MSQQDSTFDADLAAVRGEDLPSLRQPLSRERIVAAALRYIDDSGLPGLSMRRLGAALGVEAMSLYRYVPSREDLLDAIAETVIDEMRHDDDVHDEPLGGWQDFLQRMAHGVRRAALAHPRAFPLVATRPPEAPWLRPPLRSLSWVEQLLHGLESEGFSDRAGVEAYRAFTSFLLGHLLLEVSALGADIAGVPTDDRSGDGDALAQHPMLLRLREELEQDRSAQEFEESLENLLGRIELIRSGV